MRRHLAEAQSRRPQFIGELPTVRPSNAISAEEGDFGRRWGPGWRDQAAPGICEQ